LEIGDWRLEIRDSDYWLLCNEIATARQVGPRNDETKSVEFVEFIEFVGFIEIGVIGSAMRPPRRPLFPFSVTLASFELSGTSRTGFFCS
jgi:hypothetical protein